MKDALPQAKEVFERQKKTPLFVEEWDAVILQLQERQEAAGPIENLDPAQIVLILADQISRLRGAVEQLRAEMSVSTGGVSRLDGVATPPATPQSKALAVMQDAVVAKPATDDDTVKNEAVEPVTGRDKKESSD